MPKPVTRRECLTRGQIAKRWGVSPSRVDILIKQGHLEKAFAIPSCGHYREVVKIPLDAVLEVERTWRLSDRRGCRVDSTSGEPEVECEKAEHDAGLG